MKVIVGMSGGVDSSVAAFLLKEQGYEVEGLFMKNWEDHQDGQCSAAQDLADAQAVCNRLEIPLQSVNFSATYWDRVFQYFLDEYHAGRTPNPDILCNKEIKFKAFLDYALNQGADYIATGHYARKRVEGNQCYLLKGKDREKDQSYFLYAIGQAALKKSLFPIGDYPKSEVRAIAAAQGFVNHNKKDSTGICFIGERKFKSFLSEYLLYQPGEIHSPQGEVLGKHDGLMFYTLGQRQGLNIGGKKHHDEAAWYVVGKDIPNNILIVAQSNDHPLLFSQGLICSQLHWFSEDKAELFDEVSQKRASMPSTLPSSESRRSSKPHPTTLPEPGFACTAKIRYRQPDQHCIISPQNKGEYAVMFSDRQRAVTPGQSIVFYHNNICLGGAVIERAIV